MVYSWETPSIDQAAVSFLCYRSEWIKLHLIGTELFTSDLLRWNARSQCPHIDETFVCITRARATSWKPSCKTQLLILKWFTLVLTSKLIDSPIHMDYLCAYRWALIEEFALARPGLANQIVVSHVYFIESIVWNQYSATLCTEYSATPSCLFCLNLKASTNLYTPRYFLVFPKYVCI